MDKIVNLFAVRNTGFMVVSCSAFATLLNMIQSHNWVSIYGYLLFCAQFGIGHTSTGQTLKKGELELSVENFMDFLDCGHSYAYRKLRILEKAGLKVVPEVNYPVSDDLMLLIVAKNRNGRAGTVYLSHNDSMIRFGDYEPPAEWLLEQEAQPVEEAKPRSWRGKQSTYKAFKQKKKEDNGGRLPF